MPRESGEHKRKASQGDGHNKGKDGTGLGMYMSYSTIRGLFGGKMWFESEEGKGTTFFIQLPHEKLNTNLG